MLPYKSVPQPQQISPRRLDAFAVWNDICHTVGNTPVKPVAVNRPQNSQYASRMPLAVGWLTRAHHSNARELDIGRAHIKTLTHHKSRCRSGERACTRAKGKRNPTHISVLSSARARC